MKKYLAISFTLISIFITSCGVQDSKEVTTKQQEVELNVSSSSDSNEDQKDIIKIYSTTENIMIQKVIEEYHTKYPDIEIEYVIGNSDKNEDVLNEMLLKKGPDLVIPDIILEEALLKNNVLLHLNDEVNLEDIIPNLKEHMNQQIIPLRFSVPFLFTKYNTKNSTINQILENPDGFQVSNMTYDEFIEVMYLYYENNIQDENNIINEIELTEFIENIVSIAKTQDFVQEKTNVDEFDLIRNYLAGNNTIMYHFGVGIDDIKYYISATAKELGRAKFVQESVLPSEKIAINQNSKYKKECINFMELALSYDIQKMDFANGFPVNEKALDEWANTYVESDVEISLKLENSTEVKLGDPPAEDIKKMIDLIKEFPNIYNRDMKLLSFIQEESKKYYNEEASLVEITENIVKRYME